MLVEETVNEASEDVETSVRDEKDLIELACKVYEGLTEDQIVEIERIALDRDHPRN